MAGLKDDCIKFKYILSVALKLKNDLVKYRRKQFVNKLSWTLSCLQKSLLLIN